jgi:hypothetical protein
MMRRWPFGTSEEIFLFGKPALQALYELLAAQVNLLLEIRPEARPPVAFLHKAYISVLRSFPLRTQLTEQPLGR